MVLVEMTSEGVLYDKAFVLILTTRHTSEREGRLQDIHCTCINSNIFPAALFTYHEERGTTMAHMICEQLSFIKSVL